MSLAHSRYSQNALEAHLVRLTYYRLAISS